MIIKKQNIKKGLTGASVRVQNPRNIYDLYTNEFSSLTPDNIKEYAEAKRKGCNFYNGLLFDEAVSRDLRLGSLLQTRKLSIASKEWLLEFSEDSSLSEPEQKDIIKFLKEVYENIEIESFIAQTNNAQVKGVQLWEMLFATDGSYLIPERIDAIPQYLYLYDDTIDDYKFLDYTKADALDIRTRGNVANSEDRINIEELAVQNVEPLKILDVHSLDGDSLNGFLNGSVNALLWAYLFKNFGLKDWAIYIERFAVPAVIGKYPALMDDDSKSVLENAVRNFGHLFNALIPKDADMIFSGDGNKTGSTDMLKNYQEFWNTEMSLRILGQTGTTNNLKGGSFAAVEALEGVRYDIILGDLLIAARAVNKMNKRLMKLNPDKIKELPIFKFKALIDAEAQLKRSQQFVNLFNAGFELEPEDVKREFNLNAKLKPAPTAPGSAVGFTAKFIQDAWLAKWLRENQ